MSSRSTLPEQATCPSRQPISLQALQESTYQDHLEAVAELYDHRLALLCDWTSTQDDLAEVEALMEQHLEELVLGGEAALAIALMVACPQDPWSFYALVALACRLDCVAILRTNLLELDAFCRNDSTDEKAAAALRRAVADALVHFLPDERAKLVAKVLPGSGPHVLPVLAACIGARCWVQAADELRRSAFRRCADLAAVMRALGQLPGLAPGPLRANLGHADPAVAQAAAVAALRRGETGVLDHLARMPYQPWATLPIAMGGGPAMGAWLIEAARREDPAQALLALGIFGDPHGLDVLLEHLRVRAHANAAALGLFLLTGARLATPAELDEPRESQAPRARPSLHGSGISTDSATWARWLEVNRERLRPGQRYRLGTLAGPKADLAVLTTSLPLWLRRCLADELVIRYGVQWDYEPDLFVARQRELVERVRARLDDPRLPFIDGAWYFQGRCGSVETWP